MEERKLYRLPVNKNGRPVIRSIPVHKILRKIFQEREEIWEKDSVADDDFQGKRFEPEKIIELSLRRKVKSKDNLDFFS